MEIPKELQKRKENVMDKTESYEHTRLSTTPKRKKLALYENIMRFQNSMPIENIKNILDDVKEKASKLNEPDVHIEKSHSIGFDIVAYYYETDDEILKRIEDALSNLEKQIASDKKAKYEKYLELKKEFEK